MFKCVVFNLSTNMYLKNIDTYSMFSAFDHDSVRFTKDILLAQTFKSKEEVKKAIDTFPDGLFEIITVYDLR